MRIEDGDAQYTRDAIKQLLMSEQEKHNHEYNENAWWEAILASVIGEKKRWRQCKGWRQWKWNANKFIGGGIIIGNHDFKE